MIRKYHNHKLQTNTRHRQEELQDIYSNKTSKRHLRQSNRPSLPLQDDCKTRKAIKLESISKHTNTIDTAASMDITTIELQMA